jgi:putative transferase (TIGR04331 family)
MGPRQSEAYFEEQLRFLGALADPIRRALVIRLRKVQDDQMRTGFFDRLANACPDAELDPSERSIDTQIQRCRLFVYPCNSTGFLETLAHNIPTLIFWNPTYFELRDSAKPYFSMLAAAGVFHTDPESAARHVNDVWSEVGAWWKTPVVQDARAAFCDQYAYMPPRPLDHLRGVLQGAAARTPARSAPVHAEQPLDGAANSDELVRR